MLSRLKISAKPGLLIVTLMLAMVGIGAYAIHSLQQTRKGSTETLEQATRLLATVDAARPAAPIRPTAVRPAAAVPAQPAPVLRAAAPPAEQAAANGEWKES